MTRQELLRVLAMMTPSQKQFFNLGFKEGYKLGLQEAQEPKNPELPKEK